MNEQLTQYLLLTLGEDYKNSPLYSVIKEAFINGYKAKSNDTDTLKP